MTWIRERGREFLFLSNQIMCSTNIYFPNNFFVKFLYHLEFFFILNGVLCKIFISKCHANWKQHNHLLQKNIRVPCSLHLTNMSIESQSHFDTMLCLPSITDCTTLFSYGSPTTCVLNHLNCDLKLIKFSSISITTCFHIKLFLVSWIIFGLMKTII